MSSYKATFEREGVSELGDIAILGCAAEVDDGLNSSKEAGVSDSAVSIFATSSDEKPQTVEILSTQR